jgi:hypothetical protein
MADGGKTAKQLDDTTECSICTEVYTDPRVLPCFHTYCLKCIDAWGRDKKPGDSLACPLCRKDWVIPAEGIASLQKNDVSSQRGHSSAFRGTMTESSMSYPGVNIPTTPSQALNNWLQSACSGPTNSWLRYVMAHIICAFYRAVLEFQDEYTRHYVGHDTAWPLSCVAVSVIAMLGCIVIITLSAVICALAYYLVCMIWMCVVYGYFGVCWVAPYVWSILVSLFGLLQLAVTKLLELLVAILVGIYDTFVSLIWYIHYVGISSAAPVTLFVYFMAAVVILVSCVLGTAGIIFQ